MSYLKLLLADFEANTGGTQAKAVVSVYFSFCRLQANIRGSSTTGNCECAKSEKVRLTSLQ